MTRKFTHRLADDSIIFTSFDRPSQGLSAASLPAGAELKSGRSRSGLSVSSVDARLGLRSLTS